MTIKILLYTLLFSIPTFVFAAQIENFGDFVDLVFGILASLVPIIIGLALVIFYWGISGNVRVLGEFIVPRNVC